MLNLGTVPANSTLYIPWATYDANGASVTMSGLATSDILIYKNGSITQRASVSGFTLLDTDGIDFDGVTGLHGISIDLSDNTDAGFYAAGSWYWVVISTVTISAQTVTLIPAIFRIGPAENTAGTAVVDVGRVAGTAQTAGDIIGDTNDIQARLPAALVSGRMDVSVGAMAANVLTASAIASDAITAEKVADGTIDAATFAAGAINAAAIAADAITDAKVAADVTIASVTGAVGSVTGAVGSVTGNVGGNVAGSVGSVTGAVGSVTGLTAADVGAIKAKTDSLAFTVAGQVDANIQYVNDVLVTGTGAVGDEWGP